MLLHSVLGFVGGIDRGERGNRAWSKEDKEAAVDERSDGADFD